MRRSFYLLGILLILGAIALAIFIATFDVERYRPQITAQLSEALGVDVKLQAIELTWSGGLAVALKQLTLGTLQDDTQAYPVSIESVAVRLRLLPLVHKQISIAAVQMDRPNVHVVRRHDGSVGLAGLALPAVNQTGAASAVSTQESRASRVSDTRAALGLLVDALELREGRLTFYDQQQDAQLVLRLPYLQLGRIALTQPIPFKADLSLASNLPNVHLKGSLRLPLGVAPAQVNDVVVETNLAVVPWQQLAPWLPIPVNALQGISGDVYLQSKQLILDPAALKDAHVQLQLRQAGIPLTHASYKLLKITELQLALTNLSPAGVHALEVDATLQDPACRVQLDAQLNVTGDGLLALTQSNAVITQGANKAQFNIKHLTGNAQGLQVLDMHMHARALALPLNETAQVLNVDMLQADLKQAAQNELLQVDVRVQFQQQDSPLRMQAQVQLPGPATAGRIARFELHEELAGKSLAHWAKRLPVSTQGSWDALAHVQLKRWRLTAEDVLLQASALAQASVALTLEQLKLAALPHALETVRITLQDLSRKQPMDIQVQVMLAPTSPLELLTQAHWDAQAKPTRVGPTQVRVDLNAATWQWLGQPDPGLVLKLQAQIDALSLDQTQSSAIKLQGELVPQQGSFDLSAELRLPDKDSPLALEQVAVSADLSTWDWASLSTRIPALETVHVYLPKEGLLILRTHALSLPAQTEIPLSIQWRLPNQGVDALLANTRLVQQAPHAWALSQSALDLDLAAFDLQRQRQWIPALQTVPLREPLRARIHMQSPSIINLPVNWDAHADTLTARMEGSRIRLFLKDIAQPLEQGILKVRFEQGKLFVDTLQVSIGQGNATLAAVVTQPLTQPKSQLTLELKQINLDAVRMAAPHETSVHGMLAGTLRLAAQGLTAAALIAQSQGEGQLQLTQGRIANLNVLNEVFGRLSMFPGVVERLRARLPETYQAKFEARDTLLEPVELTFTLRNGTIEVPAYDIRSDMFSLQGQGQCTADGVLTSRARMRIEPDLSLAILRSVKELQGLRDAQGWMIIPVTLRGKLPHIQVLPDLEYIATKVAAGQINRLLMDALGASEEQPANAPPQTQPGSTPTQAPASPASTQPQTQQAPAQDPTQALIGEVLRGLFQ